MWQQNSRYAVKIITKGKFISASRSRSKELNLQLQLQIKFSLSMRQTTTASEQEPAPALKHNLPGTDSSNLQENFLARTLICSFE